jgi:DNA adenine methylase
MKAVSPLRYPGGKASLAGLLTEIRRMNRLGGMAIAEPFAGGAGASLALLVNQDVHHIHINDADPAIQSFWLAVTRQSRAFVKRVRRTRVSMQGWHRQREIYCRASGRSRLALGFATFYLNRCNRSGIIPDGGPIGGIEQEGAWKINARFNKPELIRRCELIAEHADRITVSGLDGKAFISRADLDKSMLLIDPPYFEKGPSLYMNGMSSRDHLTLAAMMRRRQDKAWIMTYDDCPEIRAMYADWAQIRPFKLRYSASERRHGREIMIAPKGMKLPTEQGSLAIHW